MDGRAETAVRHLAAVAAIVAGLGLSDPCRPATFSSGKLDFTGRGRACGLLAGDRDVDNTAANPSVLALYAGEEPSVFAAFVDYIGGLKGGAVGYGARGGDRWGYGAHLTYLTSGSIATSTWDDPVGGSGEDFAYTELVGGLSFGVRVLSSVLLGGGARVMREALDDHASTVALCDLGATARIHGSGESGSRAAYACILGRSLAGFTWNTGGDRPAPSLEIGLALDLHGGRTSVGCSFAAAEHGRRQALAGMSGLLSDEFEARIGYKRNIGKFSDASYGLPSERGLVAGFSLLLSGLWIDYTYEDSSPLDSIHRLGLRVHPRKAARDRVLRSTPATE